MQNLRPLSESELAQLLHCVGQLHAMRWALPGELWIKLDTYRADLLAEQEDRPLPRRRPGGHGGAEHCGCLCVEAHRAPAADVTVESGRAAGRWLAVVPEA